MKDQKKKCLLYIYINVVLNERNVKIKTRENGHYIH